MLIYGQATEQGLEKMSSCREGEVRDSGGLEEGAQSMDSDSEDNFSMDVIDSHQQQAVHCEVSSSGSEGFSTDVSETRRVRAPGDQA